MNMPNIGRAIGWTIALMFLVSSECVLAREPASASSQNWDARVLNQILAQSPPAAPDIRVGDMILPRAFVESARDRATGKPAGLTPDSAFAGGVVLWPRRRGLL